MELPTAELRGILLIKMLEFSIFFDTAKFGYNRQFCLSNKLIGFLIA